MSKATSKGSYPSYCIQGTLHWEMDLPPPLSPRRDLQGYLTHTKTPTPLKSHWNPRHRPTVGS